MCCFLDLSKSFDRICHEVPFRLVRRSMIWWQRFKSNWIHFCITVTNGFCFFINSQNEKYKHVINLNFRIYLFLYLHWWHSMRYTFRSKFFCKWHFAVVGNRRCQCLIVKTIVLTKICLNFNVTKQGQGVIFFRITKKHCHPSLSFKYQLIEKSGAHKYLWLTLDERLKFDNHTKIKTLKVTDALHKLQTLLPWQSLHTIYRSFIGLWLDYGNNIYDQSLNELLSNWVAPVQYKGDSRYKRVILRNLIFTIWFRTFAL